MSPCVLGMFDSLTHRRRDDWFLSKHGSHTFCSQKTAETTWPVWRRRSLVRSCPSCLLTLRTRWSRGPTTPPMDWPLESSPGEQQNQQDYLWPAMSEDLPLLPFEPFPFEFIAFSRLDFITANSCRSFHCSRSMKFKSRCEWFNLLPHEMSSSLHLQGYFSSSSCGREAGGGDLLHQQLQQQSCRNAIWRIQDVR